MDDLLIQTRESLAKYESSHPNLTNLWIKYIDIKVQNLENSLNHCKHAINLMNTTKDITNENILALHFIALLNNENE